MNGNDAWSAVAELAASQHGAFHKDQAAEIGLDAQRLRRATAAGRLRRALSDVLVFADWPDTWKQRHMAVCLTGAVASHRSSAALHRLDGFTTPPRIVEVCYPRGSEREIPGAQVHTWSFTSRHDITEVDGLPCTSVARTLVQLGSVCHAHEVERALDSAMRNGASAAWIQETMTRLWRPGPTGVQTLAAIIDDPRRAGSLPESWFERILDHVLRSTALPTPVRQYSLELASGIRRLDLAFPDARIGVEAHSRLFHFGPARDEADNLRDLELAAAGWEVLYITWGMAHEPAAFIDLLIATYRHRLALHQPQPGFVG